MSVDLNSKTKSELLEMCESLGFIKCKSKTKVELIELIKQKKQKIIIEDDSDNESNNESDNDSDIDDDDDKQFNDIKKINNKISVKCGKYSKSIKTKLSNINKAAANPSIPCTTKRVPQNSRIYLPYKLLLQNNLSLNQLNTYKNGITIGLQFSEYKEIKNKETKSEIEEYLLENIGSDNIVSCIIVIIKTEGNCSATKERKDKIELEEEIKTNNWLPIKRKENINYTNKGKEKWEGHYYYNISGGGHDTFKSWEGKEPQIFTIYKGFMATSNVIETVKSSLLYMLLHAKDINKVFDNIEDINNYKLELENYLKLQIYLGKSCYDSIIELKCFDKNKILTSPISCENISIDDFAEEHKLNISHNVAVSKNIILYCNANNIILSDYRPGNLFWDFKYANMEQQDNTIDEYWTSIYKRCELRKNLY